MEPDQYEPPASDVSRGIAFEGKFYSIAQVGAAAFFGGPPVAGHLLAANLTASGENGAGTRTYIMGWIAFLGLVGLQVWIPEDIPGVAINALVALAAIVYAEANQEAMIRAAADSGATRRSNFAVVGWVAVYLFLMIALFGFLGEIVIQGLRAAAG